MAVSPWQYQMITLTAYQVLSVDQRLGGTEIYDFMSCLVDLMDYNRRMRFLESPDTRITFVKGNTPTLEVKKKSFCLL